MVTKEDLLEKFQITGCENLSNEVLQKCIELCHWFDKDEEEFVDMWVAFGVGHLDGNLEPTLKALEEMKRNTPRSKPKHHNESFEKHQEQNKFLNSSKSTAWIDEENEILGMYVSSDKLASLQTKRPRSPDPGDKIACKTQSTEWPTAEHELGEATAPATPASTQPFASTFSSQSSQLSGSRVLASHGPRLITWTNSKPYKPAIRRAGGQLPADARYMFELLKATSEVRTRVCRSLGYLVSSRWASEREDDQLVTWNVRSRQQQPYRTWGRVCLESENRHGQPSLLLEGCRRPPRSHNPDARHWPCVELDLAELNDCCLFPGQILALEGLNLTESLIKVSDIYRESFVPAARAPSLTQELKLIVAAGPFTQSNDLDYQPLWELMARVADEEPHVLVLIGPFLDFAHPHVQNASFTLTYQDFFYKQLARIRNCIAGKCTQVVLVPSSRDVHHHAIYPTPEYSLPKSLQCSDIHVLPDPCVLDIEGLRLGITSIDCLMHLGREEIVVKPSKMDKLSRLGNYILNQACFYPLYPPAKEVNVDSELWEKYAFLKEKPHMMFLPSDMRYFCKPINESVILNPERLSKRTFAKVNFKPCDNGVWTQDNISCEIIKM